MAPISLQQNIFYGPIFSRRLGRSFGVNLFKDVEKVCSYNCVYCEYGKTPHPTLRPPVDHIYPVDEIILAVKKALNKPRTIQYLTLSGNGEPTLHPDFITIVQAIRQLITKNRPDVRLALLTNGTGTITQEVQTAYRLIDKVMVKLDAGDEETFTKINRPVSGIEFLNLLDGLRQTPGLTLQSCLIDGAMTNIHGAAYFTWVKTLQELHPEEVQIYSIERPTSNKSIKKVLPNKLHRIQKDLQAFGIPAIAFWRH